MESSESHSPDLTPVTALHVPWWVTTITFLGFVGWVVGFILYLNGHSRGYHITNLAMFTLVWPIVYGPFGARPAGRSKRSEFAKESQNAQGTASGMIALVSFLMVCLCSSRWSDNIWKPAVPRDWEVLARLYFLMIMSLPTLVVAWKHRRWGRLTPPPAAVPS